MKQKQQKTIMLFLILAVLFLLFMQIIIRTGYYEIPESKETSKNSDITEEFEGSQPQSDIESQTNSFEASFPIAKEPPIETTVTPNPLLNISESNKDDYFYAMNIDDSIKERINGKSYKVDCTIPYDELRYLSLVYYDFNHTPIVGEIICNKAIADDLLDIFFQLYQSEYEIEKIVLVDEFDADDDLSCAANNTSCFNFRTVAGSSTLSNHAKGMAIDVNPLYNPYVKDPNGKQIVAIEGSIPYIDRSKDFSHKIDQNDLCYQLFIEHGFSWGGDWNSVKDYQHFEK